MQWDQKQAKEIKDRKHPSFGAFFMNDPPKIGHRSTEGKEVIR